MVIDIDQNELQLLIISLGDNRYGIDIDQVAYLTNFDATTAAVRFEQLLAGNSFMNCHYSKMLLIKHKLQTPILIPEPDEVTTFQVSDIHKLPAVLTVTSENNGVWGLLPQKSGVIILIDFYKNQLFKRLASTISNQIDDAVTRRVYQ